MSRPPAPWRVVDSEIVVADRWIRVRADDCRDAEDLRIAPYYVLEYGDWISVLALDVDGNAIVVEEYRHGAGIIAVGAIGGGVEAGEAPIAAAARELREETGYTVKVGELLGIHSRVIPASQRVTPSDQPLHTLRIVYRATVRGGRLRFETDGSTDMAEWFPRAAVAELQRVKLVDIALRMAGIL